jgi:hypothetical protein
MPCFRPPSGRRLAGRYALQRTYLPGVCGDDRPSPQAGAVAGAVLTGGSAVGTVGGAAVGGLIGNEVGKRK